MRTLSIGPLGVEGLAAYSINRDPKEQSAKPHRLTTDRQLSCAQRARKKARVSPKRSSLTDVLACA
jgi:hypothetical protein